MAGDWIKMEAATPDKPEVLAMTAAMGWDDPDLTVGKLFRVWRWFDQQTTEGNAPGVTPALLDRICGVTGFASAMAKVGWLIISDEGLSLPNFDRHNGETAKKRALTAKRVAKHKSNAKANEEGNAGSVTGALPREEKRREEVNSPAAPKSKKPVPTAMPEGFGISERVRTWAAEKKHSQLERHLENFISAVKRKGYTYVDWDEALMEAIRKDWAKIGAPSLTVVDTRFKGAK